MRWSLGNIPLTHPFIVDFTMTSDRRSHDWTLHHVEVSSRNIHLQTTTETFNSHVDKGHEQRSYH